MKTLARLIVAVIVVTSLVATTNVFAGPPSGLVVAEGSYELAWFKNNLCRDVKEGAEAVITMRSHWKTEAIAYRKVLAAAKKERALDENATPLDSANPAGIAFIKQLVTAGYTGSYNGEKYDLEKIYYSCIGEGLFFPPDSRKKLAQVKEGAKAQLSKR